MCMYKYKILPPCPPLVRFSVLLQFQLRIYLGDNYNLQDYEIKMVDRLVLESNFTFDLELAHNSKSVSTSEKQKEQYIFMCNFLHNTSTL